MVKTLYLPAAFPSDLPASESRREAVARFYKSAVPQGLTGGQAGDLLDYRDFAKAVIERLYPKLYGERARAAGEEVAIHISRDRELAVSVVQFMRARFDKGADPDELGRAIARLPIGQDILDDFEGAFD